MKFFACVCVRLANRNSQLRPVNTTTTCAHKLNTASKQVNKPIARAYFDTSCKHARYNAKCSHQLLARKPHTYMSTYPSTTHAPLTLMLSCMAVDAMQYHSISCLSFAFTVSPQPPDKFNFYLLPTQPTGSKDTHNQTPVQAKYPNQPQRRGETGDSVVGKQWQHRPSPLGEKMCSTWLFLQIWSKKDKY